MRAPHNIREWNVERECSRCIHNEFAKRIRIVFLMSCFSCFGYQVVDPVFDSVPHSMKGSGRKFQGSLQWKVNGTFQGPNWNFRKGYLESFLGMLPGRFLEGNWKSFKYRSIKYYMEALREVPKSFHERLSKMNMGSFCGGSWKLRASWKLPF